MGGMRRISFVWTVLGLLAAGGSALRAQAMVENAMGTGRAATMTAPAKGLGGALNNLEKTLQQTLNGTEPAPATPAATPAAPAPRPAPSRARRAARAAAPPVPAPVVPAVHYEDAQGIEAGMAYADVVRRFGPAELEITTGLNRKIMAYRAGGAALQIELVDGTVASVDGPTAK